MAFHAKQYKYVGQIARSDQLAVGDAGFVGEEASRGGCTGEAAGDREGGPATGHRSGREDAATGADLLVCFAVMLRWAAAAGIAGKVKSGTGAA